MAEGGFGGVAGFVDADLVRGALPTARYLQILSRLFLADTFDGQQIVDALVGAIGFPHLQNLAACAWANSRTCCSSAELAVFRFTGCTGGFFFASRSPESGELQAGISSDDYL